MTYHLNIGVPLKISKQIRHAYFSTQIPTYPSHGSYPWVSYVYIVVILIYIHTCMLLTYLVH